MLLLATSSLTLVSGSASATSASSTPFTIRWSAPGDDSLNGRATLYDLRYAMAPITAANFGLATKVVGLAAPGPVGTAESFQVSGLPDGVTYYFAIKTADEVGNWSGLSNIVQRPAATTGVPGLDLQFAFSAPAPNPAREQTRWSWSMPQGGHVQVDVFDAAGRHVRVVSSEEHPAGRGESHWDIRDDSGNKVAPGVYLVRARLGTTMWNHRVVVVN
jgi:hypothetical protein